MQLSPTILAFHHVKSAEQLPPEAIAALVGAGGGGLVQLLRKMTQSKRDEEENGSPSILAGMLGGGLLGGGLGAGYRYLNQQQQGNPWRDPQPGPPAASAMRKPPASPEALAADQLAGIGAGQPGLGGWNMPRKPIIGRGSAHNETVRALMSESPQAPGTLQQSPGLTRAAPTAAPVEMAPPRLLAAPGSGVRAPATFPLSASLGNWDYPEQAPPQSFLSRLGGLAGDAKNTYDTAKAIIPHVPTYRIGGRMAGAAVDWAGNKIEGATNELASRTGLSLAELAAAYNQATQPPRPPGRIPLRAGLTPPTN